jgi:hypothetical protein
MTSTAGIGSGAHFGSRGGHEWLAALCRRYLRRFGPAFATHQEAFSFFRVVRVKRRLHPSTWRAVQSLLCEPENFLVFINRTLYQLDKKRAQHVYGLIKDVRPTQLYRHFDKNGCLLYVGISLSTLARLSQHKRDSAWFSKITRIEIEHFPNLGAALHAERKAIKTEARRERDALRILLESAGDMLHECGLRDEIFAVVDAARKGAP